MALLGACDPAAEGRRRIEASPSSAAPSGSPEVTEPTPSTSVPSADPSPEPDQGTQLLFLRGRVIRSFELDGAVQEPVVTLPGDNAVLSVDGTTAAVVTAAVPTGNDQDFLEYPELQTIDLDSGAREILGPGFSPLWSASGSLAYIEPVERRACDGEVCSGRARVVVAGAGESPQPVTSPGRWGLLGWAGSRLLVADQSDLRRTESVGPDGATASLAIPPSEIWGASPDGHWLIRAGRRSSTILALDESGAPTGRAIDVDLDGAALGPGTWAPDSSTVAAVAITAAPGGIPISRMLTLSTAGPFPRAVPGSRRAVGNVVWSPDSSRFAYAQAAGPGGTSLTARLCDLDGACRSIFHWTQGVTLLALL
ncbi:MAG: hypothetical protein M3391_08755 [Actinomycetota bacterium]|nr:hypothetical protein [Actinomycetota bacterium]